jgi:hypothetical protein
MPNILDIFNNDAFRAVELTDSINVVPNSYGRLQQMGLFVNRSSSTRTVAVQINNGTLNLLPTRPWGGTPTLGTMAKGKFKSFDIPHIPHNDSVLAADVQGVVAAAAMNGGSMLKSAQQLINEKLATMRAKHDITLEFMRWGALNGVILDADGSTILNIFTEFNVTEEVIDFALDSSTTDVEAKVMQLKTYLEDNLTGEMMTGIHVFASQTFFRALFAHDQVREYLLSYRGTANVGTDYRNRFEYMGVVFEEHSGKATDIDGNVRKFIADDTARVVPLGTQIFRTYFAPGDFMETVNTPGQPIYAKQERMRFDRGVEIHTQSNPLPMVLRPALIPKLTLT